MTANIQDNPDLSDSQVRADVTTCKGLGNLISFQEIGEDADHTAVDQILGPDWVTLFDGRETPLCFPAKMYQVLSSQAVKMHDGKSGVSPSRYYCYARLAPTNENIATFTAISTHFVSGAWTNPGQEAEQWRKDMWNKSYGMVQSFIKQENVAGRDVLVMGDFNNPDMRPFTPEQRTVAHQKYDYIIVCPANPSTTDLHKKGDARWVSLHSDHNAGAVTLGP